MSSKNKPTLLQKFARGQLKNLIEQINQKKKVNNSKKKQVVKTIFSKEITNNSNHKKSSRYIAKSVRVTVLHRDKYKCVFCGRSSQQIELQIDHIKPFSKGGSNEVDNLQTLCIDCNQGKSDRIL